MNNFFDYEFPEASDTYQRFDRWQWQVHNELNRRVLASVSAFAQWTVSGRHHERDGETLFAYPAIGLRHDSRDDSRQPSRGGFASLTLSVLPDGLHSDRLTQTGWLSQWEWRRFMPAFSESVFAWRIEGQWADGDVFEAALGGDRQLRGYVARRFLGDTALAAQAELRFPMYAFVSGVTFVETGWIRTADQWRQPTSLGGGLRFGLPPDGRIKIRADLGASDDGDVQFFVGFNQVF
jgi:outer membrane protein assembly factor BamA